jgi:4-diphosphocytidyl-2-C-methyl-D-erythritol kinase
MRGIGEVLSKPVALPPLQAVLVNPGVVLPTKAVFAAWRPHAVLPIPADVAAIAQMTSRKQLVQFLTAERNDLEFAAVGIAPVVADVLAALRGLPGCGLARMSGSGATCFALFLSAAQAITGAEALHAKYPRWWIRPTALT